MRTSARRTTVKDECIVFLDPAGSKEIEGDRNLGMERDRTFLSPLRGLRERNGYAIA